MAAPVPYRSRKTRTPEGRQLQRQVERVAEAVTATRVATEAAATPALGETRLWPAPLTPPSGWLLCDGTAIGRQAYAALFKAVGDLPPFGPGDGATTFELPDLSAWVPTDYEAYIWSGRA
jgi:microcystin-dependent protein